MRPPTFKYLTATERDQFLRRLELVDMLIRDHGVIDHSQHEWCDPATAAEPRTEPACRRPVCHLDSMTGGADAYLPGGRDGHSSDDSSDDRHPRAHRANLVRGDRRGGGPRTDHPLALVFSGGQDVNSFQDTAGESLPTRLVRLFSFFTIQSNLFVLFTSLALALNIFRDGKLWRVLRLDALLGIIITGPCTKTIFAN